MRLSSADQPDLDSREIAVGQVFAIGRNYSVPNRVFRGIGGELLEPYFPAAGRNSVGGPYCRNAGDEGDTGRYRDPPSLAAGETTGPLRLRVKSSVLCSR